MLAAIYLSAGDGKRGVVLLKKAAELEPADFRPWYAMGKVYHDLGNLQESVEAYSQALRRSPPAVEAKESRIGRVRALLDNKQAEQASEDLDILGKDAPEDPQVLALAARQALALARADEAEKLANRALGVGFQRVRRLAGSGAPSFPLPPAKTCNRRPGAGREGQAQRPRNAATPLAVAEQPGHDQGSRRDPGAPIGPGPESRSWTDWRRSSPSVRRIPNLVGAWARQPWRERCMSWPTSASRPRWISTPNTSPPVKQSRACDLERILITRPWSDRNCKFRVSRSLRGVKAVPMPGATSVPLPV